MSVAFHCRSCGRTDEESFERCPGCSMFATCEQINANYARLVEPGSRAQATVIDLEAGEIKEEGRLRTGFADLDSYLNGGLALSQVLLLSGDPGCGKSTLCLQLLAGLLKDCTGRALYATAEETPAAVKARLSRVGLSGRGISLIATSSIEDVLAAAEQVKPMVLVLDSIQVFTSSDSGGATGSPLQVKGCGELVARFCKTNSVIAIVIVQVTKDGDLAGPKCLEHLVDTTLFLENHDVDDEVRVLRARKNRYGPCGGRGVRLRMDAGGLVELPGEISS